MKSSQSSPIQPEQEDRQINRKKPSYSRSLKRNDFHGVARHRHATLSFYMGFVNINTISCYQLLIWFPFLGLLPPDLLLFVVLCKCFLASLGFFIFLSWLYYFRMFFFFDMEIHEKNNGTKGFLVTHGTL